MVFQKHAQILQYFANGELCEFLFQRLTCKNIR